MLVDQLVARAERCAELSAMLRADPKAKAAADWIADIAKLALSRREERHVAIVRQVAHLRRRIAAAEAMTPNDHTDRIKVLKNRMAGDPERKNRFATKIKILEEGMVEQAVRMTAEQAKLPILQQKLEQLIASSELLTKEDVLHG